MRKSLRREENEADPEKGKLMRDDKLV